jgi:ERCC4-type nuclease
VLVSPAEPAALRRLGSSSPLPESLGGDFVPEAAALLCVVQRKTVDDLIASVADGRLARELALLPAADLPVLLVEGLRWAAGPVQRWVRQDPAWTRERLWGLRWSVIRAGVCWLESADEAETAEALTHLEGWLRKGSHRGLGRPGPGKGPLHVHLMEGFPGVGPDRARAIVRHFGRAPLRLDCTEAELRAVEGVGRGTARAIAAALEVPDEA